MSAQSGPGVEYPREFDLMEVFGSNPNDSTGVHAYSDTPTPSPVTPTPGPLTLSDPSSVKLAQSSGCDCHLITTDYFGVQQFEIYNYATPAAPLNPIPFLVVAYVALVVAVKRRTPTVYRVRGAGLLPHITTRGGMGRGGSNQRVRIR